MIRLFLALCLFTFATFSFGQKVDLDYYLNNETQYDAAIPTPEDVFGWQIGEWHVSHDKIVMYLQALAAASDRVTVAEYARSYEGRPLLIATITSPENQKNIEKIRAEHLALSNPDKASTSKTQNMPIVLYQGYTVHGNESSGANAALLYAYHLAAGQGEAIEKALENAVVLLDPCFNPDGLNRFASWVNSHKSKTPMADVNTREHQEAWPRGRTNHYWFDLNRDWLLVQHPESKGRIKKFHEWKPNILTDHHEMGSNSTYFFQPGIPSRTNPLTPAKNQELTGKIAEYHAKALDKIGSLYYTKESFDDFYYGKGSTYPDANGCIGILFEQASSRGHSHESVNGDISFPFTIKNQLMTSISTLEAGLAMRTELLDFQRDFYKNAKNNGGKAYIFGDEYDERRTKHLVDLILHHDIKIYENTTDVQAGGTTFKKGKSYIVPLAQTQSKLIEAMFETRTSFTDSLFYDISAWTLPLAFNIPYAQTSNFNISDKKHLKEIALVTNNPLKKPSEYAYFVDWNDYQAPELLSKLLVRGINCKVATKPTSVVGVDGKTHSFDRGAILVPAVQNTITTDELFDVLQKLSTETGVKINAIKSGFATAGVDLGSSSFEALRAPNALLVVGDGVNGYDAGEVWHLLDERFDIPLSVVDIGRISSMNLEAYNTIILVDGRYGNLPTAKIKEWLENGGVIVAMKAANRWLQSQGLLGVEFKGTYSIRRKTAYADIANERGAQYIGGNILEAKLDITHPLGFGYQRSSLPVFRRGTLFFKSPKNQYAAPLKYTNRPLLAGYISKENLKTAGDAAAIVVSRVGAGRVIGLSDNPNFRAFWYGTNRLFLNSIFFGHIIDSGATASIGEEHEAEEDEYEHGHKH